MARRNIMRKFRITEISAVDIPCQEGARAAIFKRGAPVPEEGESTMPANIKKALGLDDNATDEQVAAAIAKRDEDAAKATAAVADLQKRVTLSDETRGHLDALEKAGKKDDAKAFLDMDEDARKKAVAKAREGDETFVSVDGATISKRAVGESVFSILKSQDARLKSQGEEIAKAREETATAEFTKRAEIDFAHVAGTVDDRVAVLKHLAKAPEEVRKAGEAILVAAEAAAKSAFAKVGHQGGGAAPEAGDANAKLEKMANELVEKSADKSMTFAKAYDQVIQSPEGAALYEKTLAN